MSARLLAAAKAYAFNYVQDEAEELECCTCGPTQHAEAKELFAAIAEAEAAPVEAPLTDAPSEPQRLDLAVEANRALLHKRSQVGIQKYGVTLDEGRYGEREILQHALEEALDLANYLQARIQAIQSQRGGESAS